MEYKLLVNEELESMKNVLSEDNMIFDIGYLKSFSR